MLVGAAACWGVGTVVTKQTLAAVPPLTLLPLQLTVSCVFLGSMYLLSRTRPARSPQLGRLAALGVLNPGIAYALGLLGLASITASLSVLLWATEPVLILALAAVLLHERIPPTTALLMTVAVAGVLLIVHETGSTGDAAGIALIMAAVSACAIYTVLARRLLLDDASLVVALAQQGAALGFATGLGLVVHHAGGDALDVGSLTPRVWLAVVASGVLYYGAAFWLYLGGLRLVAASVAGIYLTLVPVFGVAAGLAIGERFDLRQWLGAVVVVLAVTQIARRDARPRPSAIDGRQPRVGEVRSDR